MTNTIYFVEMQLKGSSHAEVQNHNLTQSDAGKCSPVARRCAELWDHVVLLKLGSKQGTTNMSKCNRKSRVRVAFLPLGFLKYAYFFSVCV